MTPLFDRLLVRKITKEEIKTDAGIIIATEDLEQSHESGLIVSVGPHVKFVKPNDTVLFQKNAGAPIMVDGETLFLFREEQMDLVDDRALISTKDLKEYAASLPSKIDERELESQIDLKE